MSEAKVWKQERPAWCPHNDCIFKRRLMDEACVGELPEPADHGDAKRVNTHRLCINADSPDESRKMLTDLQVNKSDLDWFRWLFDAIDGRKTSWLSNREGRGEGGKRRGE